MVSKKSLILVSMILIIAIIFVVVFTQNNPLSSEELRLEHEEKWGIYALDLQTKKVNLIHSSPKMITRIKLNNAGDKLVFSQQFNRTNNDQLENSPINIEEEICTIQINGNNFRRLTENNLSEILPNFSLDDSSIFYLCFKETLDIYRMNLNGENIEQIYDSGYHDSDLHCSNGKVVFTRQSQIWIINEDATNLQQLTNPPRANEWGNSVLPFGDYDPYMHPNGELIVFERLVNDQNTHGNYDLYSININTLEETAITNTGYTQGTPVYSHSGEKIVYLVGAIGEQGKYDLYLMNADGTENKNINPDYFPADFLCHDPIFSADDNTIYFVGEWYSD